MKKSLIHLSLLAAALFCISCDQGKYPISVFVNTEFVKQHEVILNDTVKLELTSNDTDEFTRIMVVSGENTIMVDGKKLGTYEASKADGILNIARETFYKYPIEYMKDPSSPSAMYLEMVPTQMPVAFGSFVVYHKKIAKNQESLLKTLKSNKLGRMFKEFGCRKIDTEQLYIEKNWDIGIMEKSPKYARSKKGTATKDKIISSQYFLLASQLSDWFIVEEIGNQELRTELDKLCEKYK